VFIPAAWAGKPVVLRLGAIGDCDTTYVNGVRVGATCAETPRSDAWPRQYVVPAALTATPRLLVAVRAFDRGGPGGLYGDREALRVTLQENDGPDAPSVSLAGEWAYKVEVAMPPRPRPPREPAPPGRLSQNDPGVLWDNMLAALVPYAIRGAIWYQGESNTRRAHQYRTLFPLMIQDWRKAWGQGPFPFYFVQLANYHPAWPGPGQRSEDEWAELREAQTMTLALPETGMAVTIDIGEPTDIHPRNKQEVGRRLALAALARTYGRELEFSGPMYLSHTIEKGSVRVKFLHARGLAPAPALSAATSDRLYGFVIAGRDRQFVAAEARVDGDSVVVSAPGIERPVAVRYGWSDNPRVNLVNQAGLPASPFRTDRWPGLTVGRK
jgi:sialate O-acetylesterase